MQRLQGRAAQSERAAQGEGGARPMSKAWMVPTRVVPVRVVLTSVVPTRMVPAKKVPVRVVPAR